MRTHFVICATIVCAALAGCSDPFATAFPGDAQWILAGPEQFDLLTLDPSHENFDPTAPATMHGYRILGSAAISDAAKRTQLRDQLFNAVKNNDGTVAACFNPRHAIRATRGGKVVDILICFECRSILVYSGAASKSTIVSDAPTAFYEETAKQMGLPAATN